MRALVLYTATMQDEVAVAEATGDESAAHDLAVRLNDLLLPIVKGFGSEKSYELLGSQSLQTFGGSGYLQDYPLEQYIRDAKIDTLYEGTTAIQGMDFFFRKIVRDKGQALTKLLTEIQEFAKGDEGNGALRAERDLLAKALEDVQGIVGDDGRLADRRRPRTSPTSTRSARTPPGCCSPAATWSSPGCCCARPRSLRPRSTPAPPGATRRSTRARSRRRGSSPAGAAAARRAAGGRRGHRRRADGRAGGGLLDPAAGRTCPG